MGNAESESQIGISSNFTPSEIERLSKRFKKLDLDHSGAISVNEFFTAIPELKDNPLFPRVISIFDTDGNGEIDFEEFIHGLSLFSMRGGILQKLQFAFRVYDLDNDGFISNGELYLTLKLMIGNNLKETELQQIVDKSIITGDTDGDGKISFQEFCNMVTGLELSKKLKVEV